MNRNEDQLQCKSENLTTSGRMGERRTSIPDCSSSITKSNKIREIVIRQVDRGYIVNVGCHTFAISSSEELISKISEYVNEPLKTEDKWFKGKLF